MKFCPENKCRFCLKIFCCQECRIKHEIKDHFSQFCEVINCDLCNEEENIVLQQGITDEFVEHLFKFHLPLRCKNCAVVFQNKVDLLTVHTCVASDKEENEKLNSKMAFEGDGKIRPIIEEEIEQVKVAEVSCVNIKRSNEFLIIQNGKQTTKPYNGSVAENGLSINSSDNSNRTPPNNLVRQTSTPMTKMLHEIKRHSYESMSASSIQMSSIENCTSENDISPPIPSATANLISFKPPSRRMPVGITPYRQIMSKSIQRAFSNHGISRVRCADVTPPLDLRTSPVIRRTLSMEGNARPRTAAVNDTNMIDLRTTPVIRRTRQVEAKNLAAVINARSNESDQDKSDNENNKNATHESLHKSSLSRSKSSNTFFETCKSFDANVTSSNQIAETPKTSGLSKRSSSFSNRQTMKMSDDKEHWFTPSPEKAIKLPAGSTDNLFADSEKLTNNNEAKEEDLHNQPSKGILWSLVSSVLRLTSSGVTSTDSLASNDNNSLIKRCASFTGMLPKKPLINLDNDDENPYKRRRTTTISEGEKYSQHGDVENDSGKRVQRINGRPPIDRMRQS